MSIIGRIFGRRAAPSPRIEPVLSSGGAEVSGTESPALWLQEIGFGGSSNVRGLPRVTPVIAQRHATVFACCNVIAGDLSKVPLKLYRRRDDGQEERVRDHPAAWLLNVEAAPGVAAVLARYMLVYAFVLRGNAYGYAPRDGAGELTLLDVLRPDTVSLLRAGRDRFYEFEDGGGVRRRVASRSMVHLRYMAEDGWRGRSPIEVAYESVALALAGQEAAARVATGATARAAIKVADHFEDDDARKRYQKSIADALREPDRHGFPVLGPEDDIKNLDISASDQELLAQRKMDREQLAALYRVPPSKLQMLEFGVKANGEQQAIDYLTDCLLHWGGQVEGQLQLTMLTEQERRDGYFFRHDFGMLLRATTRERYDALFKAVGGPFVTPNEARVKEGLTKLPGGDELNPAPNMTRDSDADRGKEPEDEE